MLKQINLSRLIAGAVLLISTAACAEDKIVVGDTSSQKQSVVISLDVYKRTSCSCCNKWISHLKDYGFEATKHNQNNLAEVKEKFGIHSKLQSCHTSVTKDGYVFEGHIPAKFIKKFLDEKPAGAKGLALPAMPTGTPGMEYGDLLQPYKIYLLKNDGSIEIYAEVNSAEEQI